MFKHKKGFTLVETIIAIGVSLILIAFIFIIFKKVSDNAKINHEIQEIVKIKGMVDSSFIGSSTYKNITVDMFSFPDNMYDKSRFSSSNGERHYYVINSWGGRILLTTYDTSGKYFSITYYNVPPEACYKMVVYFTNIKLFSTMGVYSTGAHTLSYNKTNVDTLCTQDKYNSSTGVMLFSTWGSDNNVNN